MFEFEQPVWAVGRFYDYPSIINTLIKCKATALTPFYHTYDADCGNPKETNSKILLNESDLKDIFNKTRSMKATGEMKSYLDLGCLLGCNP